MAEIALGKLATSEKNKLLSLRWRARTDLGFLCRDILGFPDVSEEIHGPILNVLQKFPYPDPEQMVQNDQLIRGKWVYKPLVPLTQLEGERRVLILDPRGHLKTTINATAHTIQWILNYPDIAILVIQSNTEKAESILEGIKRHFQGNPRFRALFPDHCPQKNVMQWGTMGYFTTEARSSTSTRREKTVMTGSIDKGSAGYHFDVMKFSDIVEPNNSNTAEQCQSVTKSFYMMENLLVAPGYWIDVEGTRYSFADTYGKIIDENEFLRDESGMIIRKKTPDEKEWRIHVRGVFKKDIPGGEKFTPEELENENYLYDENKKLIPHWPERFPLHKLESMEKRDPYIFSCSRGDQKILMADWSEKKIEDVVSGDTVIGFLCEGEKIKYVPTLVKNVGFNENQQFYAIKTEDERVTYQTSDHKWYTGFCNTYSTVKEGNTLISAHSIYEKNRRKKIISMTPADTGKAWYLETETGNYIVSGFLSKNCQQKNSPSGGIDGQRPFPIIEGKRPVWIARADFERNVRIAYYDICIDTAETDGRRSNYSSIAVCGWSASGKPFIVEIDHGKYLPDELVRRIVLLRMKYNPRSVKIEQTSFVRGLMPALNREMHMRGFYIPIEEIKRDNQMSKIERIQLTLQPWYHSGELRFLDDLSCKDHLIKELKEFPLSTTDDILDSLADLFQGKEWFGREIPEWGVYDKDETKKIIERSFDRWLNAEDVVSTGVGFFDRTGGL